MMRLRRSGLDRNPDFLKLWVAQTVSQFGSQVTLLAVPLTAVLVLDADAVHMGLLGAAGSLPFLLFGLLIGAWVDRLPRRPLLVVADIGRSLVLLTIPVTWALGLLRIEVLYAVTFVAGVLKVFFDVAYVSFLPSLVSRARLVEANGRLEGSFAVAQVAGPSFAGILVGAVTAPVAVLVDACGFLCSALLIGRIRAPEAPIEVTGRRSIAREIGTGLRAVALQPVLRALVGSSATVSFFGNLFMAVYVLFLADDLGLSPGRIGVIFGIGGLGSLVGAVVAGPAARRFGVGPAIIWARLLFGLGGLPIPLALEFPSLMLPMLIASEFLQWMMLTAAMVNVVSVRQALVPDRLQGRVTATYRFLTTGTLPLGSLTGGLLGTLLGLRVALLIGVAGMLVAFVWVLWSPLRGLKETPTEPLGDLDDPRAGEGQEIKEPVGVGPAMDQ